MAIHWRACRCDRWPVDKNGKDMDVDWGWMRAHLEIDTAGIGPIDFYL